MDLPASAFWIPLFEIIWIDVLLSGDNAVVIALACRALPKEQRKAGMVLGSAAAIALRVGFTLLVVKVPGLPFVKIAGGLLLLWIAVSSRGLESRKRKSPRR